jgi:hypothetical protein
VRQALIKDSEEGPEGLPNQFLSRFDMGIRDYN